MSALLAASRGAQPRVAEKARELLPSRYPYVYEFQNAIKIDSSNADLRRELADLLVAMNHRPVLGEAPARIENAKTMAEKSLKAGYLNDALRYLLAAQEADPQDFEVMLKLGWT
jgi:hypothetical protein